MNRLDDPRLLALDISGMFGHIRAVGREFVSAWEASAGIALARVPSRPNGFVIAGMGGSATAGDYFAACAEPHSPIPVVVVRGAHLPGWVSEETLVVVCSYSGDTVESLACYADARDRGASALAITRGGQLASTASADGTPVHTITYEAAPRATTVHSLAPLLRLGESLGLCPPAGDDVRSAAALHSEGVENHLAPEVPAERNGAKRLAGELEGRFPIVLGSGHLAAAATRFRNQLSENGKSLGSADALPESGHNLIVGLAGALEVRDHVALVTLEAAEDAEPAIRRIFDSAVDQFDEAGIPALRISVGGHTRLEQLLQATAWGDYVSCYLAILRGFDPTPIPQITRLRAALETAT